MLQGIDRVWVVGASSGIGLALATVLRNYDKNLVVSARSEEKLTLFCSSSSAACAALPFDITNGAEVEKSCEVLSQHPETLDMLIINAGTCEYVDGANIDLDSVHRVMNTNFTGAVSLIESALPLLRKSAASGKRPKLVVMSSSVTYQALPRAHVYGASKAAIRYFCECLRIDLAQEGIDVHVISPGFVKTPLTDLNDFPMPFLMDADQAAQEIIQGLENNEFDIHFPKRFTRLLKGFSLLPEWLRFSLLQKMARTSNADSVEQGSSRTEKDIDV